MKKILIVNANYYGKITKNLLINTKKILQKKSFKLSVIDVPGVLEIPFTISKYIKKFDAFVVLGCVIKGETPHFDLICKSTFDSLSNISINFKKPIGNGIITALNMSQAKERSSINSVTAKRNKGSEAAKAVISILTNEPKKT